MSATSSVALSAFAKGVPQYGHSVLVNPTGFSPHARQTGRGGQAVRSALAGGRPIIVPIDPVMCMAELVLLAKQGSLDVASMTVVVARVPTRQGGFGVQRADDRWIVAQFAAYLQAAFRLPARSCLAPIARRGAQLRATVVMKAVTCSRRATGAW